MFSILHKSPLWNHITSSSSFAALDFPTRQHNSMCSHSLDSIQNLSELLRKYPWALLPVTQLSAWFVTAPSDQNNCINKPPEGPACQALLIPCEIFIKLQLWDDKSSHCSTLCTVFGHVPLSHEHSVSHFSGTGLYPSGVLSSIATNLLGEIWSECMLRRRQLDL